MSDTPKTDEAAYHAKGQFQDVVAARFARELERKIWQLNELLGAEVKARKYFIDKNNKLNDALKKLLSVAEPMDGIESLRQACVDARSVLYIKND